MKISESSEDISQNKVLTAYLEKKKRKNWFFSKRSKI